METGKADDVCAIVYTSGTTGAAPKGAVHTYRTMRAGADYFLHLDPWYENDNIVPYLPPAWMTSNGLGLVATCCQASILNFAEAAGNPAAGYQGNWTKHGILWGSAMGESGSDGAGTDSGADVIKRLAFRLLMPIGYKMADLKVSESKKPSLFWKALYVFG